LHRHLPNVQSSSGSDAGGDERNSALNPETRPSYQLLATASPILLALGAVGLITAGLFSLSNAVALSLVPIAYLIPVIVAATRWGLWPATIASIASVAAADFLFFAPLYSFRIDDPQEAIDLLLFLVVALVSSNLASRLRRETETLRRRESELRYLYDFSRRLAACFTVPELVSAIQSYLSQTLGQEVVFLPSTANRDFAPLEASPISKDMLDKVASMLTTSSVPVDVIFDETTRSAWLFRKFNSETTVHGIIAVDIGRVPSTEIIATTRRVDAILEEASLTLRRLDIGKAMEDAEIHLQAQLLRDAFHGMLSHELRSPLAAIQGSASVLDSISAIRSDHRSHALVQGISEEVVRLDHFTQNLLHASRITAGGISPRLACVDPKDIVNAAVRQRASRLAAHSLEIEFADNLPFVNVDSALIEEAFGQLLENAAKYSASGSSISAGARAEGGHIILWVADHGVGIAPDDQRQLGRRSFRSQRHQATISGSGLGFWIASTFVAANAGTVDVISAGHGLGTTARISLPGLAPELRDLGFSTNG
jgi:K+-sensing histidine kinase KdpD